MFLNHVRKNKVPVTVFLINGVKLQGVISSFDNFCLLLRRDGHVQLVYKHAVSTVMPSAAVRLYDPCGRRAGAASRADRPRRRHPTSRRCAAAGRPAGPGSLCPFEPGGADGRATPASRLAEAVGLARAIDLDVVARRARAACASKVPATLLGSGKVEEIGDGAGGRAGRAGRRRRRPDARCSSATSSSAGRPRSSTAPA